MLLAGMWCGVMEVCRLGVNSLGGVGKADAGLRGRGGGEGCLFWFA